MTQPTQWRFECRAKGTKLEIAIHDIIGGSLFEQGVTSKSVLEALRAAPDAQEIAVRVNSVGGLVDEAKGIVNLLAERAAAGVRVTGYVDGLAASAASYVLTACQRVVMPSNTFQMVHQGHGRAHGTASDFEEVASVLRRINVQLAEAYAGASARRGKRKTKEDFLALFAKGDTYFDADEAIAWGLADEKVEALPVAAMVQGSTPGRAYAAMPARQRARLKRESPGEHNRLRDAAFKEYAALREKYDVATTYAEKKAIHAELRGLAGFEN